MWFDDAAGTCALFSANKGKASRISAEGRIKDAAAKGSASVVFAGCGNSLVNDVIKTTTRDYMRQDATPEADV